MTKNFPNQSFRRQNITTWTYIFSNTMIQEVLLASAGIVGAFLVRCSCLLTRFANFLWKQLYKTLIFIYYVIDGKFKGYPMLVQPLFYAMKQIPLLANHVFLNNHDHMAEMYRQYNPKHKWLKLVSGANTAFRTAYVKLYAEQKKCFLTNIFNKTQKPSRYSSTDNYQGFKNWQAFS